MGLSARLVRPQILKGLDTSVCSVCHMTFVNTVSSPVSSVVAISRVIQSRNIATDQQGRRKPGPSLQLLSTSSSQDLLLQKQELLEEGLGRTEGGRVWEKMMKEENLRIELHQHLQASAQDQKVRQDLLHYIQLWRERTAQLQSILLWWRVLSWRWRERVL